MEGHGAEKHPFMAYLGESGGLQLRIEPGGVGETGDAGAEIFISPEVPGEYAGEHRQHAAQRFRRGVDLPRGETPRRQYCRHGPELHLREGWVLCDQAPVEPVRSLSASMFQFGLSCRLATRHR